jgi:hypothetical protein
MLNIYTTRKPAPPLAAMAGVGAAVQGAQADSSAAESSVQPPGGH